MAELALEQTLEFSDYLAAFKRRRSVVLWVASGVFVLGLIAAFAWPRTYSSSSTILIEEQEIPPQLIQATVTSYAAQRIQVISQRVMTRNNLLKIIDKYNLYKDERERYTTEEILDEMRDDIKVDMITADIMDPRTGRPGAATIAFTIGFEGRQPPLVQKVASELTTLYLNENLKTRTEKSEETYEFITEEAKRYKDQIDRLEAELVEFNKKYVKVLPENKSLNTAVLDRAQQEIRSIDTQLISLDEKRIYLEGQLALLDPYTTTDANAISPAARLEALRTQYITLSTRYSPEHPDVIRLKHEIEALEQETGIVDFTTERMAQLDNLRDELTVAEKKYSDEHPDVKRLRNQIKALEEDIRNQPAPSDSATSRAAPPNNPAYVNLMTQLQAAKSNIHSLKAQRAELSDKVSEYEQRLLLTPQVESEYRALVRDYENASMRYQEIKSKEMTAEVGKQLEKERKGEKFTLIEPAALPEEPISPNRPAIIFLSLVLALGAGIGSAAVTESMDTAVRGAKGVVAILNTVPLAVIPYLVNEADSRRKKNRRKILILTVLAVIVVGLLLIHFLYTPLDVLWFRALRKLDQITG